MSRPDEIEGISMVPTPIAVLIGVLGTIGGGFRLAVIDPFFYDLDWFVKHAATWLGLISALLSVIILWRKAFPRRSR